MSKLVAGNRALVVPVELAATELKLEGALFIQQVHYMILNGCGKMHEGKRWIFNTMDQWTEVFPFMSKRTIERLVKRLRESGYLLVENLNSRSAIHTNWYTINYDLIEQRLGLTLLEEERQDDLTERQTDEVDRQTDGIISLDLLTKTSNQEEYIPTDKDLNQQVQEIIGHWNDYSNNPHNVVLPSLVNKVKRLLVFRLKYCTVDQIKDAIDLYTYMYDSELYYLSFVCTLDSFLFNHLDTFLDPELAKAKYFDCNMRKILSKIA